MKFVRKFYEEISCFGEWLQAPLLLLIRLFWGYQFFSAGWNKLMNLGRTATIFQSLNIPFPEQTAYLVAYIESICGVLLILGLASRIAAIPLVIVMIGAYVTAHREAAMAIISNPTLFMSGAPFLFLLASLIILAFGAGSISLDHLLSRWFSGKTSKK